MNLTKEQLDIVLMTKEDVEKRLSEIKKTLTPDNSMVALCGNCRYNDEMANIYHYSCYPYCECGSNSLMILYSPQNIDYIYSYSRELHDNCDKINEQLREYRSTLHWYNFMTKKRVKAAIMKNISYGTYIFEKSCEYRKNTKKELNVLFGYIDGKHLPRNI
jgi:hypothetical protein